MFKKAIFVSLQFLAMLITATNGYHLYNTGSSQSRYWKKIYNRPRIQQDEPKQNRPHPHQEMPRQITQPLTLELCRTNQYKHLRTCKIARHPSKKVMMEEVARKYFCATKDVWLENGERPRQHTRARRAVNQCGGVKTRQVLLMAYEAERPKVLRELVHDPEHHLYQTLFVENCLNKAPILGFHCRMHQIKFKAAVWSLNPNSEQIFVTDVLVDGYCALSQI